MGILTLDKKALPEIGEVASARVVRTDEDLVNIISREGTVLRTKAKNISRYSRVARGVHIMQMREGDQVASMALFEDTELEEEENG